MYFALTPMGARVYVVKLTSSNKRTFVFANSFENKGIYF